MQEPEHECWATRAVVHNHMLPHQRKECDVCKRASAYWHKVNDPLIVRDTRDDPNEGSRNKETSGAFVPEEDR